TELRQLVDPTEVRTLALSADGKLLATGLRVWDLAAAKPLRDLPREWGEVNAVTFAGNDLLLAGLRQNAAQLWNVRTGVEIWKGHQAHSIEAVVCASDGRRVALAGGEGKVDIYDIQEGRLTTLADVAGGVIKSLAFAHDGRTLAAGGTEGC